MAILGIQNVINNDALFSEFSPNGKGKLRVAARANADAASFSSSALSQLKNSTGGSAEGIFGTTVKAKLGNDDVNFNSATGVLKIGGTALELGKLATGKDNIEVVKTSTGFTVNNLTSGKNAEFGTDGKIKTKEVLVDDTKPDGKKKTVADIKDGRLTFANADVLSINKSGASVTGYAGGKNVIINTAAGANISGTGSDDKIFNFAASATGISGGGGKDAVYSVGLNAGAAIKVGAGDTAGDQAYIKLLGNMKGGSVTMQGDTNLLDAAGKTLNGVAVSGTTTDTANANSTAAVVAGSLVGATASVDLKAANAAVDMTKLNKGSVAMGTGNNSVTINSVVGDDASKARITTAGNDTLNIRSVNKATIDQNGNKSSWMKLVSSMANSTMTLGKGDNSVDGSKAKFNKTSISQDATATGSTSIAGKSFTGDASSKNNITLAGNGNSVSFSGTVSNANIELGTGANTLDAGSIKNALIKAGSGANKSNEEQNINVKGNASKLEYQGSDGDDNLKFGGGVSEGTFDLGEGNNTFTASKEIKDKTVDQNLTNVNIVGGSGANTIIAKSLTSKKVNGQQGSSSISMGGGGITVSMSGTMGANTAITLGTGANSVHLGAIAGGKDTATARISMGAANGTTVQDLIVKGGINRADITMGGSATNVNAGGALANSELNLGNASVNVNLSKVGAKSTKYQNISNSSITTGTGAITDIKAGAITSSGANSSSLTLGGNSNVSLSGTIGGNTTINFGGGTNNLYAKSITGTKARQVNINVADNATQNTAATTTMNINGGANWLNYGGNNNNDNLNFKGAISNSTLDMGTGYNSLSATKQVKGKEVLQNLTNVVLKGDGKDANNPESSMSMNVGALKGKSSVALGGDNNITLGSVASGTTIDLGTGANTLNVTKGITGGAGTKAVTIQFGAGGSSNAQNVTINGNVTGLNYVGSSGADTLTIKGTVSRSDIDLKGGVDNLAIIDRTTSAGKTITDTKISATGNSNVTAGNVTSTKNGSSTLDLGSGAVTLGNISGRTSINMGAGESNVNVGTFSGKNVTFTSEGHGTFGATSIGGGATVDFSVSQSGDVVVSSTGNMGDATLKFGSNAVTIVTGSTVSNATTTNAATGTMTGTKIEATNATTTNVKAKDIMGVTSMKLGGDSTVAAAKIGGSTRIEGGTGDTTITATNISGGSATKGVVIDLSQTGTGKLGSITTTGGADNFKIDMGDSTGSLAMSFGSVNQAAKTAPAASVTATNAASVTMTVLGSSKNLTYTGSESGDDTVQLGGENKNSSFSLGAGNNDFGGTVASTGHAGKMTNSTITGSGNTTLRLTDFLSSGGSGGSIDLKGGLADVNLSGVLSSDISLDANTVKLSATGSVTGISNTNRVNINVNDNGSGVKSEITLGLLKNVNLNSKGKSAEATILGNAENVDVNMAGTTAASANTLTFGSAAASVLTNVKVAMGTKDVETTNTLNFGDKTTVNGGKDKGLTVAMNGGTGGNTVSGANAVLDNVNLTAEQGNLTVTLNTLKNSAITQKDGTTQFDVTNTENVDVTSKGNLTATTVNASGALSLTSTDGSVTASALAKAADLTVKASTAITLGTANTTEFGKLNITGGTGNTTVESKSISELEAILKAGTNTIKSSGDITSAIVNNTGTADTAVTSTGKVSNSEFTNSSTSKLDVTGTDVDSSTFTNSSGGAMNVTSTTGSISGNTFTNSGIGDMTLASGKDLTGNTLTNSNAGDIIATATATAKDNTVEKNGAGDITISAVDVTGGTYTNTNGAGTLGVTASGTISGGTYTNGAGAMNVKAAAINGGTYTNGGGTLTVSGGTITSAALNGGSGTFKLTGTDLNNSTVTGGGNAASEIGFTNLNGGTVTGTAGKIAFGNVNTGIVTMNGGGKAVGSLLTIGNLKGGTVNASGSNLHINQVTGGRANATGDTNAKVVGISGGMVSLGVGATIDLKGITTGGLLQVNSTNSITSYGLGNGSTIANTLLNVNGSQPTAAVTIANNASALTGANYGTLTDAV